MANEKNSLTENQAKDEKKRIMRVRLLCIVPAFIAMLLSFFTLIYVFGSDVIDMGNMCYYIYVSAPGHDDDSFLKETRAMMLEAGLTGWTVKKNLRGAYMESDGSYVFEENSYQIILMATPKQSVEALGRMMLDKFNQNTVLIEEVISTANFMEDAVKLTRLRRKDAMNATGFSEMWQNFIRQFSPNF